MVKLCTHFAELRPQPRWRGVAGEQRKREAWLTTHLVLLCRRCNTANLPVKKTFTYCAFKAFLSYFIPVMTWTPSPDNKQKSCERGAALSLSLTPPPLHICSQWPDSLSVNFKRAHKLLPCARVSPHVLQSHVLDCFLSASVIMLGVFRFKLNLNWFFLFFFALQPPPAITDKQLDEREHTVEEWKGGNELCFYLFFWSNHIVISHRVFVLPVSHLILITGGGGRRAYRWLKLLAVWDCLSVCRVDIQRSVGLGRKNKKRCHQGTASIHRLVEFLCWRTGTSRLPVL